MDRYNLIALGMLLTVVVVALMKGAIDGLAVKEIVMFLSGGVVGVTMPRRDQNKPGPHAATPAMVMLAVGSVLLLTR